MKFYLTLFCLFIFSSVRGQWNNSSLRLKNQLKYKDAVAKYESFNSDLVKDFEFARTLYKIGEYEKSYREYLKLHNSQDTFSAIDIQYFLTLAKLENQSIFDSLSKVYKSKPIFKSSIKTNFLISGDSSVFEPYVFNSKEYEDFGPTAYNNKLIFVSSRTNPIDRLDDYSYNSQPFYNVYFENNNEIININDYRGNDLPKEINTDFHDGPIHIAENQKMVFITRNIKNNQTPSMTLGIFYSIKKDNKWSKFISLPVNSTKYSVQHPFYNESTQELYFSSNLNNNNFNIFKVHYSNNAWQKPVLVNHVNTNLDEVFPYVYKSKLFFSSNGFDGKGGFDIYYAQNDSILNANDLNSMYDDYGILYLNDSTGYLSSNRNGGFGKDDIIKFHKIGKKTPSIEAVTVVNNPIVKNSETVKSPPKKDKILTKQKSNSTKPIAKNTEIVLSNNCGDLDQDGILDYKDLDSDNDDIPDKFEGQNDLDKDGIPNYLDSDSDNDGILDIDEGVKDSDNDKKPDFLDIDSDNDGIEDKIESLEDSDNDGIPNYLDLDSDNDGINDKIEGSKDKDQDGSPNYLDLDSDNDGIIDKIEGSKDFDKDGLPNFLDLDSDGDGILDEIENGKFSNPDFADADGDGQPNYLDLDSDMDGIPDKLEKSDCVK